MSGTVARRSAKVSGRGLHYFSGKTLVTTFRVTKEWSKNTPVLFQRAYRTLYFGFNNKHSNQGDTENDMRGVLSSVMRNSKFTGLGTISPQTSNVCRNEVRGSFL